MSESLFPRFAVSYERTSPPIDTTLDNSYLSGVISAARVARVSCPSSAAECSEMPPPAVRTATDCCQLLRVAVTGGWLSCDHV